MQQARRRAGGEARLAAVVLAAGAGTRLRPLTDLLPKPLCPVNGVALVDDALRRVSSVLEVSPAEVAVNVNAHRERMHEHLEGRVHLSDEEVALGTAGALGRLRDWVDGRAVLVVNGDTWSPAALGDLVEGWDGERIRLLCQETGAPADFGSLRYVGAALMPWADVAPLAAEPTGLYEVCWRDAHEAGRVELLVTDAPVVDCGTPADYLKANLVASGGRTVVGEGSVVLGRAEECVLWPGVTVGRDEALRRVIRARNDVTVEAVQRAERR